MAHKVNAQNYLPPIRGMPAAYRCPHAHKRSVMTGTSWFVNKTL